MKTVLALLVVVLTMTTAFGQENIFLERDYWKGNPSIADIEMAIAKGNDIAELNKNMFDAVSYALLENVDNATVKYLIGKEGNPVDKITHDGRTYMFWAAYKGNLELMKWLSAQGAKCNIEDAHGNTVLNFAANAGQTDIALYDFLLANDADIEATTRSGANALLLVAAAAEDEKILTYFQGKGLSFDSVDSNGNGIFQYAAKGGNPAMLDLLAKKGAKVDLVNKQGENALFMAAQGTRSKQHNAEYFDYLVGLGLSADVVNTDGRNLLHALASRNKDAAVFTYFFEKGLDANLQDKEGRTPLMNAARSNTPEVVQLLTTKTKDINRKDAKGNSALALAVSRNQPEVVKYLLDQGADIAVTDTKGNTLAYYVMQTYRAKNPEVFEAKWDILSSAGLTLNEAQHDGNSLLHLAAKENNLPLLKRLEVVGLDVNQKNDEGNTPLHLAAMSTANTDILEYLIQQGADVSLKTEFEESVFDLAKENEFLQEQEIKLDFLKSK